MDRWINALIALRLVAGPWVQSTMNSTSTARQFYIQVNTTRKCLLIDLTNSSVLNTKIDIKLSKND